MSREVESKEEKRAIYVCLKCYEPNCKYRSIENKHCPVRG